MRNITVAGSSELKLKLSKLPDTVAREVSVELKTGANEIARDAKRNAPGDQGTLQQLISVKENNVLDFEVISGAEYSPFVEFGTLTQVSIPPGLEEYAAQFKGNGASGNLSAKEAIFAWCERHGIEKEAWFAIFLKIMRVGVKPHPFFFPAINQLKPVIIDRVKTVVEEPK